jgi:hypothetical protein
MVGRYGNEPKRLDPKEQSKRTRQENSPTVKSWLAIKDTIALQPSTISELKELATCSELGMWSGSGKTFDDVILLLIRTYRQAQKAQQWQHDHNAANKKS